MSGNMMELPSMVIVARELVRQAVVHYNDSLPDLNAREYFLLLNDDSVILALRKGCEFHQVATFKLELQIG